jgi:predicted amino acid racemase
MFLDVLRRRNPAFLSAVATLHQRDEVPANSYVVDLEAVRRNAETIAREAAALNLEVLAMTKQVGRHPDFAAVLVAAGIDSCVAVDMDCARLNMAAGLRVGNIGHLVQVPRGEASAAAALEPANWTVYNLEKATEAAEAARSYHRTQDLLLRVHAPGDTFYSGHEGGFPLDDLPSVLRTLDQLAGARVAGVTTFPALLFDESAGRARLTPNVQTLEKAAAILRSAGVEDVRVNAPGTTSSTVLNLLAEAGATQVEPGHGLTGTTPLHARDDLPEEPAAAYVSEVSHHHDGRAYFYGGGLYVDPVFHPYEPKALVFPRGGGEPVLLAARLPPPEAIDYYGQLEQAEGPQVPAGSTVVLGFRFQAFVTRANVVGIEAVSKGGRVTRIVSASGTATPWQVHQGEIAHVP